MSRNKVTSSGKSTVRQYIGKTLQGLAAALAVLLLCIPAFSQGSAGTIAGTITDSNGGAITGATVTITDVSRGTIRTLTTDQSGAYAAPNLLPGQYKVRAEFKGFKASERQNITLEVAQEIRVDLSLQPGEQAQTITVTEDVPLINTTNAELGGTIQGAVVNELPLNGRNFENLLTLRPGTTIYSGGGGWTQSSNGLRPHDNMYLVEGVNSNDPWMAQSMMNAAMAAGDAGTILPIDAIDEFKTIANPSAEYGWKPGSVVNVGIKSGTNSFHGSGYAYGRSDAFDAIDLYSSRVPVQLEQYGASIGGPVIKDKLFFFGNFESQQYNIGNSQTLSAPITTAGATDPVHSLVGACNAVLSGGGTVAPLSAHLAGITVSDGTCTIGSTPGLFPATDTGLITTNVSSDNKIYSGVGKVDYHLNDKNSFSGMFFMSPGNGTFVDNPGYQFNQIWLTDQYARAIVGSVGWTYIPNSSWVNSFRFGTSHYYQIFHTPDSTVDPTTYGIYTGQTDPASFGLPLIRFGGFAIRLGGSWPKTVGPDAVTQFSDSVSWLHGNHSIKFGFEFLLNQDNNQVTNNTKGPVYFASSNGLHNTLENFFAGNLFNAKIAAGNFQRQFSDHGIAGFAQDDWRVTPRLTINAGIRYEFTSVFTEANNLIGNFSPTAGLEQVGANGYNSPYNPDYNNFSPRLGFAWDVFGDGKTVVRGGGGILYEQGSFDSFNAVGNAYGLRVMPTGAPLYANGVQVAGPTGGTIDVNTVTFTNEALTGPVGNPSAGINYRWQNNSSSEPLYSVSPACGDGSVTLPNGTTPGPCTILGVDQNLRTPYVATWTLGIQRAITNNLSLEVSYVGNHATKLVGLSDLNQPPVGAGWTTAAKAACVLSPGNCAPDGNAELAAEPFGTKYPYLGNIGWLSNSNESNYDGLQVALTQHAWKGLSYVLGYTWSHALGESPDNWSFISPINSNNPREIYGTSQFDITHRFTFSATYDIPGMNAPGQLLKGWSLNSVVTLESALPWGVNDLTTDFSGTNEIASMAPNGEQWDFFGNPGDFQEQKSFAGTNGGAGGIPYFAGTTNATCLAKSTGMGALAVASLTNLGCYAEGNSVLVPPAYGSLGTTSPNMFRGMPFYNVDLSVTKMFKFGERLNAQFRVEVFNLFNRADLVNPYGGPGGSNQYTDPSGDAGASFGYQPSTPDAIGSNPILGSGGARAMQLGLKLTF